MPLELNSPPIVAINCDNRKAMGKNGTKQGLKNQQKMITENLRRKNDKVEIKFELSKELECK